MSGRVKLLMTWDMKPGLDQQEYFEFMMREFVPRITRLGLEPSEYWFTQYGDRPQFMAAAIAIDRRQLTAILGSQDWSELEARLMNFVVNLDKRVVSNPGGFNV